MTLSKPRFCALFSSAILAVLLLSSAAQAAKPVEIPLWTAEAPGSAGYEQQEKLSKQSNGGGWINGVSRPTLTLYPPAETKRCGTAMIVCPGGGYAGLSIDHEGHAMAQWCAERGIFGAVLKYRHDHQFKHPIPLNDAQRALRLVRSRAKEWGIQPDKIGIAGFSAGGHLASTAGTHFAEGNAESNDPIERESSRANFLVLVYPVISMDQHVTHQGSRQRLISESPSDDLVRLLSNELQVTADTGPTFLVHATEDRVVPVENSLRFYQALCEHKVPAEMHIYEKGGHGFGLLRRGQPVDQWTELLEGWLKGRKLLK